MNTLFVAFAAVSVLMLVYCQSPCDNVSCINGYCTLNALAQAVCQCEVGYKPSNVSGICIDIDECIEYDFLCEGPHCCNTLGSFYCLPCAEPRRNAIVPPQFPFRRYDY